MQQIYDKCQGAGVHWRPHCKAHKSPDIAKLLIKRGAVGITCAKLAEAESMFSAGIENILIANQIVGVIKISRLMSLISRGAVIAVSVDSSSNVRDLAEACRQTGNVLEVMIEIDSGSARAGVEPGEPVLSLAREILTHAQLKLRGLMTWEGHTVRIADPQAKHMAIVAAITKLTDSAELCRSNDIKIEVVSCGGTGTYRTSAALPGVTEIQAGGGIFGDVHYRKLYHVPVEYALFMQTTVTSRPSSTRIICDAGKKAMSSDTGVPIPLVPGLVNKVSFSAEHSKIELAEPSDTPHVAGKILWITGYADSTVHLHQRIYAVREGKVVAEWRIPSDSRLL
ncbi:TPA: alanine racemase [Klebsiella michiganensis]|nr:alanine racemase [Klebsiella michiganensis]